MANPNIVGVVTINGNTAVQQVSTSATAIVTNSPSSSKVYKLNGIVVSNVDASVSAALTVDLYRGSTATRIINGIVVTPRTSYTPVDKSFTLYLLEGDSIRLTANTNSILEAVASWEEIS